MRHRSHLPLHSLSLHSCWSYWPAWCSLAGHTSQELTHASSSKLPDSLPIPRPSTVSQKYEGQCFVWRYQLKPPFWDCGKVAHHCISICHRKLLPYQRGKGRGKRGCQHSSISFKNVSDLRPSNSSNWTLSLWDMGLWQTSSHHKMEWAKGPVHTPWHIA